MKFKPLRRQFSIRTLLLVMMLAAIGIVVFQVLTSQSLNERLLSAMQRDRPSAIKFYLWLGADPNNGTTADFSYGGNPLHDAALGGNTTYAKHLIDAGATVNFFEKDGFTPIVYAASEGHWEIVKMLYDAGADHRAVGADGNRVIEYAIAEHRDDIVRLLTSKVYPPGYWVTETVLMPIVRTDAVGNPYNRVLQIKPSSQNVADKWPQLTGIRKFIAMVEQQADGTVRTTHGVESLQISEDQNWVEVTYADGSTERVPI